MKKLILLFMAMAMLLAGCGPDYRDVPNPVATITMEDGSQMRIELFLQKAPNTVANFVELAEEGFYDGLYFHRVLPGCLVQTGDPTGSGTGGPGYSIKGEFLENGFEGNDISHMRGTVSMARQSGFDTAGSQFFILEGSYPEYDGKYAAFGKLMDDASLAVLDSIALVNVDGHYKPLEKNVIASIRVDTQGYEYESVKIEEDEE